MEELAIHGGTPVKTTPYGVGKRFGEDELRHLKDALEQNTLFYWHGKKTRALCEKFASMNSVPYCVASSSGTAAIHVALGALDISVGDEVITSPITDMGSIIGILFQNAVPVFADVDPHTYNMDPALIEACITPRTKAIEVVHLAGNSCDMDAIMDIAKRHNLKVIEDCAQAYGCTYKGRPVGTFGDVGCFSLNDFKHISAGDGGMCIMKDEALYDKAFRFADKNYNRRGKQLRAGINGLGANYRMNELTAAVGLAQLDRIEDICEKRYVYGEALTRGISGLQGIYPHKITEGCKSSYWFYMLRINEDEAGVSRDEFCSALNAEGIICEKGYLRVCVYEEELFLNKSIYPGTRFPFDSQYYKGDIEYKKGLCPTAEKVLETAIKLPINEFFTENDLNETIAAIRKVHNYYFNRK